MEMRAIVDIVESEQLSWNAISKRVDCKESGKQIKRRYQNVTVSLTDLEMNASQRKLVFQLKEEGLDWDQIAARL